MTNKNIQAIVLAAGGSTRFKTEQTKLSFLVCGQELIVYPIKLLEKMGLPTTLIVGHQKELLQNIMKKHELEIDYVEQLNRKGTGHAVLCSRKNWYLDHILITVGDAPLINEYILQELIDVHLKTQATLTLLAAHNSDPSLVGYGRVVKSKNKVKIIEQRDTDKKFRPEEHCINAGIYIIKRDFLEANIEQIQHSPVTGEMYLTELVSMASEQGCKVEVVHAPFDLVIGINTLKELWAAEHIKRSELISYWMGHGVRFSIAQNVHIDLDVVIGAGTFIGAGALLLAGTRIGRNCIVDAFSMIKNSVLHDNATVLSHTLIEDSVVESGARVGPFAHVAKDSIIGKQSIIGNFVEVSASTIQESTKAKHLSYLGNAQIGSHVNIGAGTITCNYDGASKHQTVIKDGAFIGSNNSLIAPVIIGKEALTGAGSTITENVPDGALGIARAKQVNKEDDAYRIRDKKRLIAEEQKLLIQQTNAKNVASTVDDNVTRVNIQESDAFICSPAQKIKNDSSIL